MKIRRGVAEDRRVSIEDPEMAVEFDPIIGRSMTIGVSDAELMRELSLAYAITHNHDYIKMLRVLRRLR